MGLIRLHDVRKQFGERRVLDGLTLDLHTGQRVGLVGANGSGKTTLIRIIAGLLAPDSGTVTLSKGLDVGYLPQEPQVAEGQTLHDEVLGVFADVLALERKLQALSDEMARAAGPALAELMRQYDRATARFEAAGGYSYEQRLGEILGGLGFTPADFKLPMAALSGGQKCRAALARLLLAESQFLLLDEPTNHLDLDAVRWLEKFLAGHRGGAVLISHDRYLLDRLADRIVELADGQARAYPGNYSNYVAARDRRALTQERQYAQDQAFIAKERDFIARNRFAQKAAQARGRLTRLQRRLDAGEFTLTRPPRAESVKIRFEAQGDAVRAGRNTLEITGLAKSYGDKALFSDLSLEVPAGSRLGITGPNGTGKTTLLKIVLGQVPADAGQYRFAPQAALGYFAQEATGLDPDRTIVQEIMATRPDLLESQARSCAARFLFRGEEPFKRIAQLSGGEQSRVRLMKLILTGPNVLILDEPTNHLDIPAREALEQALLDFDGTIIAVSHDRYFLDRICGRLLVLRGGAHRGYDGNYSYYIAQVERERAAAQTATPVERPRKSRPAARGSRPAAPARPRSPLARLKFAALEELIMQLEAELGTLQDRFGDARLYQDPESVSRLRTEFERRAAELAAAQAEWERRVEQGAAGET